MLAIRERVEAMPLGEPRKAMVNFYPQVFYVVEAGRGGRLEGGGGAFKDEQFHSDNALVEVQVNSKGEIDWGREAGERRRGTCFLLSAGQE